MTEFHFANTGYLFLLPLLPLMAWAVSRADRGARARLLRFLAEENLQQLLQSKATLRSKGKILSLWLGLALVILALARPQANPKVEEIQSSGLDIYALLDVSRSMDAEDIAPSRLKKAKRTIQHLASRLSGDRLGVIAFANSAVLVSPLTNDFSILDSYLQNIDTSLIPSQGTNLGNALEIAKEAMERGANNSGDKDSRSNIFLVLSDGEDHGESDLSIADSIREAGGQIFSVAFGTEKGAPIPIRDERGVLRNYKTSRKGEPVITAVKTGVLQEVAKRGGGYFYFSTLDEGEVEDMLARINEAQRGGYTKIRTILYEEFYWIFLIPGTILLLFSFLSLRELLNLSQAKKIDWKNKFGFARAPFGLLILLLISQDAQANPLSLFWNKERQASEVSQELAKQKKYGEAADSLKSLQAENPDHPALNYNIGTYLLSDRQQKIGREQLSHLRNADGLLRSYALYNIAGSLAMEGKKAEARATYAELIQQLQQKSLLNAEEQSLLDQAKRNVARLADPHQQPQSQPQKSEQKEDQKQKDQGSKEGSSQNKESESKDQKNQDNKNKESKQDKQQEGSQKQEKEKEKNQNQNEKDKNEQDKDQDKKNSGDGEDQEQKEQEKKGEDSKKPPMRRGPQPFRERDNMGENEAKRILGALKERESDLQKKFLKNNLKGGRVNVDDAAKDW